MKSIVRALVFDQTVDTLVLRRWRCCLLVCQSHWFDLIQHQQRNIEAFDSPEKAANRSAALEPYRRRSETCSSCSDWLVWSSSGVRSSPLANRNPYPSLRWEELWRETMFVTSCWNAVTSASVLEQRPAGEHC